MTSRRDFLARTAAGLGALTAVPGAAGAAAPERPEELAAWIARELAALGPRAAPEALARNERFWARVRRGYALDPDVVNLDHGWTNPAPGAAVDALARAARTLESLPAEHLPGMRREVTATRVRRALAEAMGVPPEEIALVRNATEALDTVLLGLPLERGDEVVCSTHDYFAMLDALEQRRARDGIVLRLLTPPAPAASMDALAELYEAALGPRTRLVLLTHPSNRTGQLLPVRRIADAARRAGAEVVVDGAQSLGLLERPVASLGCDYYGASAHKWLGAPVGLGVLWMRPEHASKVWPLVASSPAARGMARFEATGTSPEYVYAGALPALAIHGALGAERKAARLRYLTRYWRARVAAAMPAARFSTSDDATMAFGLCTVSLPGADHAALQKRLRERERILVQAVSGGAPGSPRATGVTGLRVSPNVYTSVGELERFTDVLARA